MLKEQKINRAAAIYQCTGEAGNLLSRDEYRYFNGVLQNNKIFLIKNQKLLNQHSELTVLISLMTPYKSFISHRALSLLSIASHAFDHVFFKMVS